MSYPRGGCSSCGCWFCCCHCWWCCLVLLHQVCIMSCAIKAVVVVLATHNAKPKSLASTNAPSTGCWVSEGLTSSAQALLLYSTLYKANAGSLLGNTWSVMVRQFQPGPRSRASMAWYQGRGDTGQAGYLASSRHTHMHTCHCSSYCKLARHQNLQRVQQTHPHKLAPNACFAISLMNTCWIGVVSLVRAGCV